MNKQDLINKLSERSNMKKVHCEKVITDFINILKESVAQGHDVKIRGFGTFEKCKRAQRIGIDPRNGSKIRIPSSWVARFRTHKEFKKSMNPEEQ